MSHEADEIIDLATQVAKLARAHSAWSMVYSIFQNLDDHLRARAKVIRNREESKGVTDDHVATLDAHAGAAHGAEQGKRLGAENHAYD